MAACFAVRRIAVALEPSSEWGQEVRRSLPCAAHLKIVNHQTARHTVFPKVGLMVFALGTIALHRNRGFVRLNVLASQKLGFHGGHHAREQFSGLEHRAAQRGLTDLHSCIAPDPGGLPVERRVVAVFFDDGFHNETVGEDAFFDNGKRRTGPERLER